MLENWLEDYNPVVTGHERQWTLLLKLVHGDIIGRWGVNILKICKCTVETKQTVMVMTNNKDYKAMLWEMG